MKRLRRLVKQFAKTFLVVAVVTGIVLFVGLLLLGVPALLALPLAIVAAVPVTVSIGVGLLGLWAELGAPEPHEPHPGRVDPTARGDQRRRRGQP